MLKNKVCVKNEGITQDIFDAMVAVAKASGFQINDQNKIGLNNYDLEYILISKDNRIMINCSGGWVSHFGGEEISLEDWLFSLAPEWADRLVKSDGDYWYASKVYAKKIQGGERIVFRTGFDLHTIATRKQEQWTPRVGEECLVLNQELSNPEFEKCRVLYMGNFTCVYNSTSCTERTANIHLLEFKPLPEHTEQELLAYELYANVTGFNIPIERAMMVCEFKRCLKIVESGRFK